jgi:protein tyrosine kinase modulator
MNPIQSFDDLKDMLRRRALLIFGVFVLGCLASVFVALQQQHVYESTEVIQIAQPKIADELAKSTAEGSSARRLQLIEQRLMARSSVLEMIDRFGLYPGLSDQSADIVVLRFRQAVQIRGVAAAREGSVDDGTISIISITAQMPTALLAQRVAHELAQRTIELSIQSRIEQAKETLAFFSQQEAQVMAEIDAVEEATTDFRNSNDLALTGTVEFRRGEIATINEGLLDIAREEIEVQRQAERATATERPATAQRIRAQAEEQLATLEAQRQLLIDRKTELESSIQTTPQVERTLGEFERKLEQLREELAIINSNRAAAEIGFRLESSLQSERLTVLEPAPLPDYPVTGSRKILAAMGAAASLMLALAIAYIVDFRNPVLRTAAQMERHTGLTPVVSIPTMNTKRKRRS